MCLHHASSYKKKFNDVDLKIFGDIESRYIACNSASKNKTINYRIHSIKMHLTLSLFM